jgi:SAM-dependent methyltransferase
MQQDPDEALWRPLAADEAEADRAAQDCAALLRLPLSAGDALAVDRALDRLRACHGRIGQVSDSLCRSRGGVRSEAQQRMVSDLSSRVHALGRALETVRRIMVTGAQPLYPEDVPRDLRSEQALASDRAYIALNKAVNPEGQAEAAVDLGCFPDIPLAPSLFLHHAHAAYRVALAQRRPAPLRFLDVGCGGGLKVLLAAEFFGRADGLEYDTGYADTARRVLDRAGRQPSQVIHGDALTFEGYGDYDVIYFYQPMKSPEGLIALERQIIAQARPGTILIAPYALFSDRSESLGCGRVDGAVYLTRTLPPEAREVCRQAEYMGIEIARPDDTKYETDGYLKTLIDACHAVGYEVV